MRGMHGKVPVGAGQKPEHAGEVMKRLLGYLKPYWIHLILVFIFMINCFVIKICTIKDIIAI